MKSIAFLLSIFVLLFLTACDGPSLGGKKVKREYFTGGKVRTEFIMDDETELNGTLKKYGYNGNVTSSVQIRNGVKNGIETGFDEHGRVLWKMNYLNGKQHGEQKAYYPNNEVMVQYMYNNGVKDGPAYSYNQDGSVNKKVIYRQGKMIN